METATVGPNATKTIWTTIRHYRDKIDVVIAIANALEVAWEEFDSETDTWSELDDMDASSIDDCEDARDLANRITAAVGILNRQRESLITALTALHPFPTKDLPDEADLHDLYHEATDDEEDDDDW